MEYPEHGTRVLSHEDERESWSFALRAPAPALRDFVKGYCLYKERRTTTTTHQHLPQPGVTFIVGLDGKLDVRDSLGELCEINAGEGFIAGVNTAPAQTHSERSQRGMEIAISPLGTHILLGGMPMDAIANRAVSMEDLLGRAGRELGERLAEARDHATAFDLVDGFFTERLLDPPEPLLEGLAFAWESLARSHGRLRISEITDHLGWSRRRLVEDFRRTVGVTPKALARVLRFDHALELWKADPTTSWTEVALASGFHDQAHFSREVKDLSGQTPSELASRLLPESGGMLA